MLKSQPFKTSFIATIIFLTMILAFLITDFKTKTTSFRNSPELFKVENINSEYYNMEIIGNKFEIRPLKINIDKKYAPIARALIPKKLTLIESFICYSYATYNDFIKHQKDLDYLNNIKSN